MLSNKTGFIGFSAIAVCFALSIPPALLLAETAVEWQASETFDDASWTNRWDVEGNSRTRTAGGTLLIEKKDPKQVNVSTVWFRPELPQDTAIRVRAHVLETASPNAANLNVIFHAREADGSPLRTGRSGDYKEYHRIPNYIVTFTGGFMPGWSRIRRNPGFRLLSDRSEMRSEPGRNYELLILCSGGRIRTFINGTPVHDATDPSPLPGGRLGLRTWNSTIAWDSVDIGRIIPTAPGLQQTINQQDRP